MKTYKMYKDFNILSSLYFENKCGYKTNILNHIKERIVDLHELYILKEDINHLIFLSPENKKRVYYKMNKEEIFDILINISDFKNILLSNLKSIIENNENINDMIGFPYEYRVFIENIKHDKKFFSEMISRKLDLDFIESFDEILEDISLELSKTQIEVELLENQDFKTMEELIENIIRPYVP